ncbi:MAG: hypothetical protein VXY93_16870, partial [Pseudomonadota bacterium]|nr:hypothetical protein [Pseudomonadota bacterium]
MALTDLTRISTSGIATGSTIDSPVLRKDVSLRGSQVGVTSALFDSSDDALEFNDNVKLKFGNDGDLEIGHIDDQNIIEDKGNGALILKTNGSAISLQRNTGATMLSAVPEQDVRLFFNGNQKLNTTNDGVVVTGILTASSFSGPIGNP